MFFRSLFYERTVLSLLDEVKRLPPHVQAEIAARVNNYINQAKDADDIPLDRFVETARKEREKISTQADKPAIDLWAAPALAEAWCTARLGLSNASLDQHSAPAILVAIETFASERALR
jgi:hypothetical protein